MEHMSFRDYWKLLSPEGKTDFAAKLCTSVPYISQIANGHRMPSRRLAEFASLIAGKTLEFDSCCED